MGRWTARTLLGAVLLAVFLLAGTPTITATPAVAAPAVAFCIEDVTRARAAVRAAVAELDSVDAIAATHHAGVGGCPDAPTRTVRVMQTSLPSAAAGVVTVNESDRSVIKISDGRRFTGLSRHDQSMVVLHELMHVVLWYPNGSEWNDDGHTDRCDSVLSHDSSCALALDGLTDYDREQIARAYS